MDKYVLEWSQKQNAFHTHTLESMIEKNLNAVLANNPSDYIPLIIGTRQDCDKMASKLRYKLMERQNKPILRNRNNG